MQIVNPLAGIEYEQAWGPGGGTHAYGQNWQSSSGWDLLHAKSTALPVRAPFDGVVQTAGQGGTGRFAGAKVGIEGTNGYSCFLTHMSRITVRPGQRVTGGQIVGYTGQANGVWHLHFAMCRGPYRSPETAGIDPGPYLVASADLLAFRGPKGYPLYRGETFPPRVSHELQRRYGFDFHRGRWRLKATALVNKARLPAAERKRAVVEPAPGGGWILWERFGPWASKQIRDTNQQGLEVERGENARPWSEPKET